MRVYLNPNEPIEDVVQTFKYNGDRIQITIDNKTYLYDFSDLKDGKSTKNDDYVKNAKRVNGELSVELTNFLSGNASQDELFPEWQIINGTDELDCDAQLVPIEWYGDEEREFDELLNSLQPSPQELADADLEIKMLTLLMEMEVI